MSVEWLFFEIGINVFQGWLYSFFLRRQLTAKPAHSNRTLAGCTAGIILVVTAFYSLYIPFELPFPDTVVFIFTFLYSLLVFSEPWYTKLLWNVVMGVIVIAITSLVSQLFIHYAGVSWEVLMEPSLLRLGFVLCGNIVLFIAYYVVTKMKPSQEKLSWVALALFILLNAVLLLALEMQYKLSWQPGIEQAPVLITIFCLIFASAGLLVMFELLSHKAEKQAELELEIETKRMMEKHLEEVHSIYQRMMEYEHDMKHQINALQKMIAQGNMNESSAYLEEFRRIALPVHYATGCVAVDALLSAKLAYMNHQQIDFEFVPYPLNELPIEEPVLCAIVGNLLDNAIEAIRRIRHKNKRYKICLSFARIRDMFFIVCKNETGGVAIQCQGRDFLSAKRRHRVGYGIASIRHSAEKADGSASFRVEDGVFVAEVVLTFRKGDTYAE